MSDSDSVDDTDANSEQSEIKALKQRITELERKYEEATTNRSGVTRRQTLGLLGGGALFGVASQPAVGAGSGPRAGNSEGGQWSQTDDDALLELPDHDGVDVQQVETGALNSVLYAQPGEVQAKIDRVATSSDGGPKPNAVVKLLPQQTYNEGEEIWVKPCVTLDFNGALLEVSNDHNGLFIDNESKATNVNIVVTHDGYASDVIVLDAKRTFDPEAPDWERAYGPDGMDTPGPGGIAQGGENNGVEIDGVVRGNTADGTGLALRPYAGQGIFTNNINLDIYHCGTGILADTSEGWINGVDIWSYLHNNRVQIDHVGDRQFNTMIYGHTQNGWYTDYHIRNRNTAGKGSCMFIGQIWDSAGVNESALAGPDINVITDGHMGREVTNNSPEAGPGTLATSWENGKQNVGVAETGDVWQWNYTGSGVELRKNGDPVWNAGE